MPPVSAAATVGATRPLAQIAVMEAVAISNLWLDRVERSHIFSTSESKLAVDLCGFISICGTSSRSWFHTAECL
jgi:hypothetical protein